MESEPLCKDKCQPCVIALTTLGGSGGHRLVRLSGWSLLGQGPAFMVESLMAICLLGQESKSEGSPEGKGKKRGQRLFFGGGQEHFQN